MIFQAFKKSLILPEMQVNRSNIILSRFYLIDFKNLRRLCLYSGRARALISTTRSSRHNFRTFFSKGLLYGVKKHSW